MEWLILILGILLIGSIFIIINLLRKAERLDDELTDVSLTLADVLTSIEQAYKDMVTIDSKGLFQSDDETGHIFTSIKQ